MRTPQAGGLLSQRVTGEPQTHLVVAEPVRRGPGAEPHPGRGCLLPDAGLSHVLLAAPCPAMSQRLVSGAVGLVWGGSHASLGSAYQPSLPAGAWLELV